jgi:hypothetical protein
MGKNGVNDERFLLGCIWGSILGQLSGQELLFYPKIAVEIRPFLYM